MDLKTTSSRHELEDFWRSKLEEAQIRYKTAAQQYRSLLGKASEGSPLAPGSPLARARQAESEALSEYTDALRVFNELVVCGKRTKEQLEPNLIAVVDDDGSVRKSIKTLLRSDGYRVETFESAESFLASGVAPGTRCLIVDVRMPGMGGLELLVRLNKSRDPHIPIIFITAHGDGLLRQQVIRAGALDLLDKPFAPAALLSTVGAALGRPRKVRGEP